LATTALSNDVTVKINKTGGIILAVSDVNLPSSTNAKLIFVSGCINTKIYDYELFVANPSTFSVLNASASSHVVGRMKRATNQLFTAYEFPVSDNETQWAKASITPSSSDLTNWSVEFISPNSFSSSGLTPGVIDVVSNYYWNISKSGISDMAYLQLFYNGLTQSTVAQASQLKVLRLNNDVWQNLGGTPLTGSVENNLGTSGGAAPLDPISSFGQFAIGGILNTLPVSILYFTGKANPDANVLQWMVACSSNNGVEFSVEKSLDGTRFESAHQFFAQSNQCNTEFKYEDRHITSGTVFYRIKMKDSDWKFSYSQVVPLTRSKAMFGITNLYPNPYHVGKLNISVVSAQAETGTLQVIDLFGRKLMNKLVMLSAGENIILLQGENWPNATYRVVLTSRSGSVTVASLVKK
jgi:hypothetical protein